MIIDFKSFLKKKTLSDKGCFPYGSRVYKAFIGGGKTLSMTHDIFKLKEKYPKMITFANYNIYGLKDFYLINSPQMMDYALSFNNGEYGVIVAIDEAHLFWLKKDGIPVEVLSAISYQRKDRKKILMTTQVWDELPVSTRKQVMEVVNCIRVFNMQINVIYNGSKLRYDKKESAYIAPKLYTSIFKHNDELYKSFNTTQKAIKNDELVANTLTMAQDAPPVPVNVNIKKGK